jgi:hypothetical protein
MATVPTVRLASLVNSWATIVLPQSIVWGRVLVIVAAVVDSTAGQKKKLPREV